MGIRVGIPRALLYYNYYPAWKTFFEELGAEVIVSEKTSQELLNTGIKNAVEEACLPVKIFFGHVTNIKDKVDYLFIPRLVSIEKKAKICPKFLGLPEMIKYSIKDLPPIIDTTIDCSKSSAQIMGAAYKVGKILGSTLWKTSRAYLKAKKNLEIYQSLLFAGYVPEEAIKIAGSSNRIKTKETKELTILLLGHPYNIYDTYFSMDLLDRISQLNINCITPEMLDKKLIKKYWISLPRNMYWSFGRQTWGAVSYFLKVGGLDGIIYLTAFGCGVDSFLGELIERQVRASSKVPFMLLNIDEHTSEIGMVTRLEAFIDMVKWREMR